MRILQTVVSSCGFRNIRHNQRRIDAAQRILAEASQLACSAVVLPAGFLHSRTDGERNQLASSMRQLAATTGVSVLFGIDQGRVNKAHLGLACRAGLCRSSVMRWTAVEYFTDHGDSSHLAPALGQQQTLSMSEQERLTLEFQYSSCFAGKSSITPSKPIKPERIVPLVIDLGHKSLGMGLLAATEHVADNLNVRVLVTNTWFQIVMASFTTSHRADNS